MKHHFHAVVSVDHAEALVLEFSQGDAVEHRVRAQDRQGNIHHKAGSVGSGHTHDSKPYLAAIVSALNPAHEILIVGHGTAKEELVSFIRDRAPLLAPRIMGVKAVDQLTKNELLACARRFFKARDLMTPRL